MKYYCGVGNDDTIEGGGQYNTDNIGHEEFNFKVRDGIVYGFVQPTKGTKINLGRIDPKISSDLDSLDKVLVIFVATHPLEGGQRVIGYYTKAIVYRDMQNIDVYNGESEGFCYNIKTTKKSKIVLLSDKGRNYIIPKAGKDINGMGQSNVCYVYSDNGIDKDEDWIDKTKTYVYVGEFVQSYCNAIASHCSKYPSELVHLTNKNFKTTNRPLLKSVEEIIKYDESIQKEVKTLNYRYYNKEFTINGSKYRFHSQWGGSGIWDGTNRSISHDEKHREPFIEYLKELNLYDQPSINKANMQEETQLMKETQLLLKSPKKQLILQGAPGTGKTYKAKEIRNEILGRTNELENKSDLTKPTFEEVLQHIFTEDLEIPSINGHGQSQLLKIVNITEEKLTYEYKDGNRWNGGGIYLKIENEKFQPSPLASIHSQNYANTLNNYLAEHRDEAIKQLSGCNKETQLKESFPANQFSKIIQFHPSYSYEDFVRGISVSSKDGNVVYNNQNKVLAEMALRALSDPDNNYVLIIDEINRANLPAVLGELIYALEYRGEAVESIYEYEGSREIILPENLYIIGTMNTTDRSLGHIDYAIRRRFLFSNVEADIEVISEEGFTNSLSCFEKVEQLFNEAHLSPEFDKRDVMIGHSYFLTDDIELSLEYEIKPILMEYIRDGILINAGENQIKEIVESLTCD